MRLRFAAAHVLELLLDRREVTSAPGIFESRLNSQGRTSAIPPFIRISSASVRLELIECSTKAVAGSTATQRSPQPSHRLESAPHGPDVVAPNEIGQPDRKRSPASRSSRTLAAQWAPPGLTPRPQRPCPGEGAARNRPAWYLDRIELPRERDRSPQRPASARPRRWAPAAPLRPNPPARGLASSCWGPRPARSVWPSALELAGAPQLVLWSPGCTA